MTPQEKAQELIDKFNDVEDLKGRKIIHFIIDAKQCALIAVDEILDALNSDLIDYSGLYRYEANNYWNQVKDEIEKI